MYYWPFSSSISPNSSTEALESKMADQVMFTKRVRKSLYYGEYSDASLPSLSVTDVAVEVLNSTVPPRNQILDRKYAHSVTRRAKISPCTLMMGMLYAERLRQRNPHAKTNLNSSDVFLISIMVASKYIYDEGEEEEVYNEDWAKAGCKTVQDINKLEMDFLQLMDWNLFISKEEFLNFVNQVESRVAMTKGCARGWLTYSDMCTLLHNTTLLRMFLEIRQQLLKNISKCVAAYILGVSILLGTSALATNLTHDPAQQEMTLTRTPVHPSFNCVTTEESCVFSCENIEVSSQEKQVFHHLAQRIRSAPGSSFRHQILRNITSPGHQTFGILKTAPQSPENRTFAGSSSLKPFLETLGSFSSRNLEINPSYDRDSNNSAGDLSVPTDWHICVHKMNESTSHPIDNLGTSESLFSKKGCFEDFLRNCESSRESSLFHRQKACIT